MGTVKVPIHPTGTVHIDVTPGLISGPQSIYMYFSDGQKVNMWSQTVKLKYFYHFLWRLTSTTVLRHLGLWLRSHVYEGA